MSTHPPHPDWLSKWLPRAATRLVVLGSADPDIDPGGLGRQGLEVVTEHGGRQGEQGIRGASAREPVASPTVAVFAVAPADEQELATRLRRASEILAPKGRLLLGGLEIGGGGEDALFAIERLLLEQGFVIRPGSLDASSGSLAADFDGYSIEPYRAGDESAILELFRRAFHVTRSREHWSWKYESNPCGARHVSLARDPERRLVGQYCAYPVRFFRNGSIRTVHQVGDTMTAGEARSVGRGPTSILARAARHFYATYCRGRVDFNYGFNTGNIQRFSILFVRATKVEEVPFRRRDLREAPPKPLRGLGGYRPVSSPTDRQLDDLWRRAHRHYGSVVVRDSAYLRWRYLGCPDQDYTLVGARRWRRLVAWGVFSTRGDQLVWGDLLVDPSHPDALETVLAEALRRVSSGPLRDVVGWFPPRPAWLDRQLEASGFERLPEPQQLGLMVVPFEDADAPEHCAAELFYTYGDSDLF